MIDQRKSGSCDGGTALSTAAATATGATITPSTTELPPPTTVSTGATRKSGTAHAASAARDGASVDDRGASGCVDCDSTNAALAAGHPGTSWTTCATVTGVGRNRTEATMKFSFRKAGMTAVAAPRPRAAGASCSTVSTGCYVISSRRCRHVNGGVAATAAIPTGRPKTARTARTAVATGCVRVGVGHRTAGPAVPTSNSWRGAICPVATGSPVTRSSGAGRS